MRNFPLAALVALLAASCAPLGEAGALRGITLESVEIDIHPARVEQRITIGMAGQHLSLEVVFEGDGATVEACLELWNGRLCAPVYVWPPEPPPVTPAPPAATSSASTVHLAPQRNGLWPGAEWGL